MCGIAGASLAPQETVNSRELATALMLRIEERGRHATGVAWVDGNDETWVTKGAVPAKDFVKGAHVPNTARTFIAHTRYATHGATSDNRNNHPIDVEGIVGIHNGVVWNDKDLFELIGEEKRIAEVDSEAIFATILHSGLEITDTLELVDGSAAVAWYAESDTPRTLNLARIHSSPIVVGVTEKGSVLFASTERAVRGAATAVNLPLAAVYNLPEGIYHRILDGEVISAEGFGKEGTARELSAIEKKALNVA